MVPARAVCLRGVRVFRLVLVVAAASLVAPISALGATVFSNDFESDTAGFTNTGALPALTRTSLPTDGGGIASPNQSMWLGRLGQGILEGPANPLIVELVLTGLTPGASYTVAFDLLVGASWDGAAVIYGPDAWHFSVDGTRLIDTIFSNGDQGIDFGAYSPQRYTDASYATPAGPDVPAFTGAEFSRKAGPGYSGYYGIYAFGRGAGNPVLSFTAGGTSATLQWVRSSGGTGFGAGSDEYWALDNVEVRSATPQVCAGDVNGDGSTNAADFVALAGSFGHSVPAGTSGDLNDDGVVNAADFVVLAGDFGCSP